MNSNMLGLLERRDRVQYVYLKDKSELQNDHLYYLYFREKPANYGPSGAAGAHSGNGLDNMEELEEMKKVKYYRLIIINKGQGSKRIHLASAGRRKQRFNYARGWKSSPSQRTWWDDLVP